MVWQEIFVSEKAYHKFREWWSQRSLTLEKKFIKRNLLPHNPNIKQQFDEIVGWKHFTSKLLEANKQLVKEFYANVTHIKNGTVLPIFGTKRSNFMAKI